MKFGKLTVIDQIKDDNRKHKCVCICDCGNKCIVLKPHLINGHTKSCGCLRKELSYQNNKKFNKYDLTGEYGIGFTNKNEKFYFDIEDYDKIKNYCWHIDNNGYVTTTKTLRMHSIIMNAKPGETVDHINHNKYDNRKSNLRLCNKQQNSFNSNTRKNSASGFRGVSYFKRDKKWRAYICINNKFIHIGYFEEKQDAIRARKEAEIKYFGDFRNKTIDKEV